MPLGTEFGRYPQGAWQSPIGRLQNPFRLGDGSDLGISDKMVISLATTPARATSSEIFDVLDSLTSQRRRAKKIYLALPVICWEMDDWGNKRQLFVDAVKARCGCQVEIVGCDEAGPETGLLGLLDHSAKANWLDPGDVIINVEDEVIYSDELVHLHELCHDLYQCDVAVVDQDDVVDSLAPLKFRESDTLLSDENRRNISSWLSFSIRFDKTADLPRFFSEAAGAISDPSLHPDMIFSAHLAKQNLYATNIKYAPIDAALRPEARARQPASDRASDLGNLVDPRQSLEPAFRIPPRVAPRPLQNCSNFSFAFHDRNVHLVAHYLADRQIMVTVTVFNPDLVGSTFDVAFRVANERFKLPVHLASSKFTSVVRAEHPVFRPLHDAVGIPVVQTNSTSLVSRNKFYSVCTILNHTPAHEYLFFDEIARRKFSKDHFPELVVQAYDSLIPRTYRADLFRYLFAYLNKCIYFDVKMVLNVAISTLYDLDHNGQVLVKDVGPTDVYTAFFINRQIRTSFFRCAIVLCLYRIIWNDYSENPLMVTGPGILGLARLAERSTPPLRLSNGFQGGDWQNTSTIRDENGTAIINCSYPGYYAEDNYGATHHYNVLWHNRQVFRYPTSHFVDGSKNGIDGILSEIKRI
jgi:hypothetical protein